MSFELESDKSENIKELIIFYWYNFYWKKQKHSAFQNKIVEENKSITAWLDEKKSYSIPISFFNLKVNDWYNDIKIENYLDIRINNGLFSKIKEKIIPNIVVDEKIYNLSGFYSSNYFESSVIENIEIEKLIIKNDEEGYLNIINKINENNEKLLKITDLDFNYAIEWKEDEFEKISDSIKELVNEKNKFFVIKEDKKEEYKILLNKSDDIQYKFDTISGDSIVEYNKLLNESNWLEKDIYMCYLSNDEEKYYNELDNYYKKIFINENSWIDHISNKVKIWEKIENSEWDFIILKKKFKWILNWWLTKVLESSSLTADFIHKDIYNNLKQNIIINLFDKLVNSKIYNFIYKYVFIFIILVVILNFTYQDLLKDFISFHVLWAFNIFGIVFPIFIIFFSKWYEILFAYLLKKWIYNSKLNSNKNIKDNIESKLVNWTLKIEDIIKKLDIKTSLSSLDYNLKVSLGLNVWTYAQEWKNRDNYTHEVYSIDLFNHTWKGYFDLNKVKLLNNDYKILSNIMPNSNKKAWTKIYYSLYYKLDSSYLPDIEWSEILYLENK